MLSATSLSCILMNNQKCKVIPQVVNFSRNKPVVFPFSITTSKCSSSWNNINNPYGKLCIPDVAKTLNFKVFNLMWRTNGTRQIEWNETFKCKCRLYASVCNNKQYWNDDKWRREYKELVNKGVYDKVYNPSTCQWECDKSCDVCEYLDYENCNCRKKIVYKLVEEC